MSTDFFSFDAPPQNQNTGPVNLFDELDGGAFSQPPAQSTTPVQDFDFSAQPTPPTGGADTKNNDQQDLQSFFKF